MISALSRLTKRKREQVWRYFPAMLELEDGLSSEWLLDLRELAPTPEKARRVREASITKVLNHNRIRRFDAAHVLSILRNPAVKVAAGTTEAATAHIATLIARAWLINQQRRDAHRQLDLLTTRTIPAEENEPGQKKQHDVEILASVPGVERIVLTTLLAKAFDALQRRDFAALHSLTAHAPVTKHSGKSCIVIRRQACSDLRSNAVYQWLRVAVQCDARCRAKSATSRGRGHNHGRALRSVANRLLKVACAMLKTSTTFKPSLVPKELLAKRRRAH